VFTLKSDEGSLRVYPFPFELRLRYVLDGRCLSLTYSVANTGQGDMYFSIGGHPAFAVPMTPDTLYTDYYLQFNGEEPMKRWKLQDGLLSGETEPVYAPRGRINLDPALFYEDALVFRHLQSTEVTLGSARHTHGLRFRFEGFPYLGIWAAKNAPFLCIEPWCGHADRVGHNQNLTEKEGIEKLASGAVWQRTWSVECY
jgi:galactose mutarotase-like enzyme